MNDSVLLFSGGMDSVILQHLLKPKILLYFAHENKYQASEIDTINKLIELKLIPDVIIDNSFNFKQLEREDAIIPLRNLYFLTMAANYASAIYLGSVLGDRSLDKSKFFFRELTSLLNYLYQPQHWIKEGKQVEVLTPYKDFTKTEMVTKYLKNKGNVNTLLLSYSCYSGNKKPCGECKPCFRKWVSLKNNKINTVDYFEKNPRDIEWIKEYIPKMWKGNYRGKKEDMETLNALEII